MTRDDLIATLVRIKKQVDARRTIRRVLIKLDGRVVKTIRRGSFIDTQRSPAREHSKGEAS